MLAFVLSRARADDLQTPVFSSGPDGDDKTVLLFTDAEQADRFCDTLGWNREEVVGLEPIAFLKWLIDLQTDGTEHLAVNPRASDYQGGRSVPAVNIEHQLRLFAGRLLERWKHRPGPLPFAARPVRMFLCPSCGNTVEQRLGNVTPTCCGRAMQIVDPDAAEAMDS